MNGLLIVLVEKGFALDIISYFVDGNKPVSAKHLEIFENVLL